MYNNTKPSVLVMTSTFPHCEDDLQPTFVIELCRKLANDFNILILAPHASGTKEHEYIEQMEIIRFRYAPTKFESLTGQGGILSRIKANPWKILIVPLFIVGQYLSLRKILKKYPIDLIHAHWIIPQGFIASLLKDSIPLLITSHGSDLFSLDNLLFSRIKRYTLQRSSAVTVVSTAMKYKLEEENLAENKKIFVLPMGTDLIKQFTPRPITPKQKSIIYVGRLIKGKGLIQLIDAFNIVKQKHKQATLTIVGSGPDELELIRKIKEHGLQTSINLIGYVSHSHLPELYRKHAIAVFPSISQEGLGLVIVEALGCGCAIVASDLAAVRDIIADNKTGLLADPSNPSDLADKLLTLLDNPELANKLAKNGRRYVLEEFDWSSIGPKYLELFNKLTVLRNHDI